MNNNDFNPTYETTKKGCLTIPSIYKPFYIKRLYTIDMETVDPEIYYRCRKNISVYNGIGVYMESANTSNDVYVSSILNNDLNTYFGDDSSFSDNFQKNYDNTKDTYAIGVVKDSIVLNERDVFGQTSIFRNKPLILSDYNDSVFDTIEEKTIYGIPVEETEVMIGENVYTVINTPEISVIENFASVQNPYSQDVGGFKFNNEVEHDIGNIQFAQLFRSSYSGLYKKSNGNYWDFDYYFKTNTDAFIEANDYFKDELSNINGIRYYIVNKAFYSYYIYAKRNLSRIPRNLYYKQEYYNNREIYDLNPHNVNFKETNVWNINTEEFDSSYNIRRTDLNTSTIKIFNASNKTRPLYISNLGGRVSKFKENINGEKTVQITAENPIGNSEYPNAYLRFPCGFLVRSSEVGYDHVRAIYFWVQNDSEDDIVIYSQLYPEIGETASEVYNTNNGIIVNKKCGRYVEFVGYPHTAHSFLKVQGASSDGVGIRSCDLKVTTITAIVTNRIIPFFDMKPSLKNTEGFEYSTSGSCNTICPMCSEVLLNENGNIILPTISSGVSTLYLIGVYSPLTRLSGESYVNEILYGNELIPQEDETTIIYSYGEILTKE